MSDNSGANVAPEIIAHQLDQEFRTLDRDYGLNFARRAVILKRIQDDELWAFLTSPGGKPYRSFNQWLECAAPYSERDCRYALSAIKELKDIPESDFKQMPRETIETIKEYIPRSMREDYIEAAKTMKPEAFFAKVDAEHPEFHMEKRRPIHIKPDESQGEKINTALRMAQLKGATSKTQAWEMVAEAALEWWQWEESNVNGEGSIDSRRGNLEKAADQIRGTVWPSYPDSTKLPN